ncbi:WD40 repeat-like protein, partial [Pilatotrama ljubarskyi]
MAPVTTTAYIATHTLQAGHSDTINTLRFSLDGDYLASGADDHALVIWSVAEGRLLYKFLFKSPVSAVIWHPMYPESLIVGCDDGTIVSLREFSPSESVQRPIQIGVRSEVHCMTYDPLSRCLAIALGNEVYLTREQQRDEYSVSARMPSPPVDDEQDINADAEHRLRAMGVHFRSHGKELIVSYLSHGIYCYDVNSRAVLWKISPAAHTPNIGSSAISPLGNNIAVYNVATGVDVYNIGIGEKTLLKTYKLNKEPQSRHRLQTAYAMNGHRLVCGTTTGDVCVWLVENGHFFQQLSHNDDIIMALDTVNRGNSLYIATGATGRGQNTYIKLWQASLSDAKTEQPYDITTPVGELVEGVN